MGMRKQMDYNSVHHQIYMSGVELHSHYNDGFNQFEIKKDLHRIKWLLDEIMADRLAHKMLEGKGYKKSAQLVVDKFEERHGIKFY